MLSTGQTGHHMRRLQFMFGAFVLLMDGSVSDVSTDDPVSNCLFIQRKIQNWLNLQVINLPPPLPTRHWSRKTKFFLKSSWQRLCQSQRSCRKKLLWTHSFMIGPESDMIVVCYVLFYPWTDNTKIWHTCPPFLVVFIIELSVEG